MSRLLLVLRTARHLRPRQIVSRLARRFAPAPRLGNVPPLRTPQAALDLPFLPRRVSYLGEDRFRFLNDEREVPPSQFGAPREGLLWDYNFHYFDGLLAPSPDEDAKREWVARWVAQVPVGGRPAWDPYPASRRISNWIKWHLSSAGAPPNGFLESLAAQVRHLERTVEYHLMANHLLANAVALVMAGAFFGGKEGDGWLRRGGALLEQELGEQFLPDGAHFELSPIYHSVILEDLLDLIVVSLATGAALPPAVEPTALAAAGWLAAVVRPDGRVPLLNDAAYDQGPEAGALLDYATEVLGTAPKGSGAGVRRLTGSGYFRYEFGRLFVLGDVGPIGPAYQPGHGHCDMLSFELCWDGSPVVVDTGTSTYEVGPRRAAERGTVAHSTVQLGDLEQSEIWAGFRVARRAQIEAVKEEDGVVSGTIRAFPKAWSRLSRTWTFNEEAVEIEDRILAAPRNLQPTARLHFHPDVSLAGDGDHWTAAGLRIRFEGATAVREVGYQYAPEFNTLVPARCLEIDFHDRLLTRIHP